MEGWVTTRLDDLCVLRNGRAYKKEELLDSGKYPVLRVGNFFTSKHWYYSDLNLDETKYCDTGDLLYAWSASFGPRIWEGSKTIFHYHIWRVDFDHSQVTKEFLFYWFEWDAERIKKDQGAGTTMLHVSMKSMNARGISYPSILEQKQIVAILDEAFAAIATATANADKNLANARELFESQLFRVSEESKSYPQRLLSEVATEFNRGRSRHRPRNAPHLYGGTYPFIQTGDIRRSNHWITVYSQTYSEAGLDQSKLWTAGTVCITIAANIAESGILTFDACFPDSVIGVVVDKHKMSNQYLEYILQAYKTRLQAEGQGAAQDNINLGTFQGQRFPVPPLEEQQRCIDLLDRVGDGVSKLGTSLAAKTDLLAELKQSILHKAFTGELTADKHTVDREFSVAGI